MNNIALSRRAFGAALGAVVLAAPHIARAAGTVRIGYQKNGSLALLRHQDRLRELGLAAEWLEFASGPPLLEALNAGAVDFGAVGDTPPIFAQAAGSDLVYVGGQPNSGANEAILALKGGPVKTVADLRGKRVAFTKGSSSHAMMLLVLAANGMTPADIQPVYLQPPDAAAAFRSGALDAWSVWDPFFAVAQREPTTLVVTTGEGVAPTNAFFMASRKFALAQPATIVALLGAINASADWARANPEPLAQALSSITGVPLEAERIAAPRGLYAVQPMDDAIIARQQGIADQFARMHIIPQRIDVRAIVWTPPGPGEIAQVTGSRP